MHPDSWRYRGCLCVSILLCKADWFAWLSFGAASPFVGFVACFFAVACRAECLQVVEAVRTAACDVEDMVNLQALGATALNTPIAVALEGLFAESVRRPT